MKKLTPEETKTLTGDELEEWVDKQLAIEYNLLIQNYLAPDLTGEFGGG